MIIGVDASRANRPKKTGVEWYSYEIIQHLKRLPAANNHSWLLYSNAPLTHGLELGPPAFHEVSLPWAPKYLWTQARLSLEMWQRPPDVLYVPSHVLPRIIPKRTVVVIHDIGFRRFPELYKPIQRLYHEWSTRDILKRASRVVTVSDFSKQELVEVFGAEAERIHVMYPGIDHDRYQRRDWHATQPILDRFQITKPFFLFVGRLERKKNIDGMIRGFERYMETASKPATLVLAGQPGAGYDDTMRLINESPVREHIYLPGYINEEEKIALLSSATALVHAAWYEGFGIPIVEAMACRCPVICSAVASLPEVAGAENALWFDPANHDELAEQMRIVMQEGTAREERLNKAQHWASQYTWEDSARHALQLLTDWS